MLFGGPATCQCPHCAFCNPASGDAQKTCKWEHDAGLCKPRATTKFSSACMTNSRGQHTKIKIDSTATKAMGIFSHAICMHWHQYSSFHAGQLAFQHISLLTSAQIRTHASTSTYARHATARQYKHF